MFGKVVQGMDVVKRLEQLGTSDGKPTGLAKIVNCGETSETKTNDAVRKEKGMAYDIMLSINVVREFTCTSCAVHFVFMVAGFNFFRHKEKVGEGPFAGS